MFIWRMENKGDPKKWIVRIFAVSSNHQSTKIRINQDITNYCKKWITICPMYARLPLLIQSACAAPSPELLLKGPRLSLTTLAQPQTNEVGEECREESQTLMGQRHQNKLLRCQKWHPKIKEKGRVQFPTPVVSLLITQRLLTLDESYWPSVFHLWDVMTMLGVSIVVSKAWAVSTT